MDPNRFSRIAESLRQYRRAELKDFDEELGGDAVAKLYVDPLPNDAILKSVLSSSSTFLLGRKGTGKSTVISRAQAELRKRQDTLSVYVDVKSLYDVFSVPVTNSKGANGVDAGVLRAHLLRKAFLGSVLSELLKDIDQACDQMSLWDRWVGGAHRSYQDAKRHLSELTARINSSELKAVELPVLQLISRKVRQREQAEQGSNQAAGFNASIAGSGGRAQASASASDFEKTLDDREVYQEYSEVVLRSFPFVEMLEELRGIVASSGLKRLVVFFDDFSELGVVDQRLFVDVILSPLNNSSGELVKLKVAGYPGRIYYGKIDSTKVDTISLDFCDLYEDTDVQSMERSAINYLTRLVNC